MAEILTPPGDVELMEELPPQSPGRVFWRQMRKSPLAIAGGALLALFYLVALIAPFVAPYPQEEMDRERYFHPPQTLHWVDANGSFHFRPFVYQARLVDPGSFKYEDDVSRPLPLRFFVTGSEY